MGRHEDDAAYYAEFKAAFGLDLGL
jgi:hypothetical protein